MSALERRWWIVGPAVGLAVYLSFVLVRSAGVLMAGLGFTECSIFFLCVLSLSRIIGFAAAWVVAAVAPTSASARP